MGAKKGVKKRTFRIVPIDDTRKVSFVVTFNGPNGEDTKELNSRAELFSWIRGAEMFNVSVASVSRTVSQSVTVEAPGA